MQSNSGSSAFTYREFTHNLQADPEVVKVVAMYTGGGPLNGHVIEGVGAGICDDDANNGCNEYGAFTARGSTAHCALGDRAVKC